MTLVGFRNEFLTITRGEGALHHVFDGYAEMKGEGTTRSRGVLPAEVPMADAVHNVAHVGLREARLREFA